MVLMISRRRSLSSTRNFRKQSNGATVTALQRNGDGPGTGVAPLPICHG